MTKHNPDGIRDKQKPPSDRRAWMVNVRQTTANQRRYVVNSKSDWVVDKGALRVFDIHGKGTRRNKQVAFEKQS